MEDGYLGVVAEPHVVELDASLHRRQGLGIGTICDLDLGLQEAENALARGHGRLQHVEPRREVPDRLEEPGDEQHEGRQHADGQLGRGIAKQPLSADPEHQHRGGGIQQVRHRENARVWADGRVGGLEIVVVHNVEVGRIALLAAKRLHDPHPHDVLGEVGVHVGHGQPQPPIGVPTVPGKQAGNHVHDRQDRERHEGEPPTHTRHNRNRADEQDKIGDGARQPLRQHFVQRVDVGRLPRDDLTDRGPVVVAQRE